jgi:hypothetical protein
MVDFYMYVPQNGHFGVFDFLGAQKWQKLNNFCKNNLSLIIAAIEVDIYVS